MSEPTRGGREFSWHKRPGWTCCYVEWRDGKIVRRMWVPPPGKAPPPDHVPDAGNKAPRRGALAAERPAQDDLFAAD